MGVDTIISTVMGTPQLRLIEAAVQCRVRRFAPAEFEGQPGLRGQNVLLDRGRNSALALLQHYRGYIQSTVFVCGILYERFSVNGMISQRIGTTTGYGSEGDYIANPRTMTAIAPVWDAGQNLAYVCLTSAYDVARFVVRSLDLPSWTSEMSMCGERMSVNALVELIRACRSMLRIPTVNLSIQLIHSRSSLGYCSISRSCQYVFQGYVLQMYILTCSTDLQYQMSLAQAAGDTARQRRLAPLLATAEGRYDFAVPGYLNAMYPDIRPTRFRDWFLHNWAAVP